MTPEPRGDADLLPRLHRVLDRRPDLLPPGEAVLVAFSGGPDSTALLDLLRRAAFDRRIRVLAAHFDHGLRPESAEEAERVARRAAALGVVCAVGRAGPDLEPAQEALREARYRFLRDEAERSEAARIATGHQADDQAETVLFRILRGTGLRGLAGIPRRRGPLVRPLLDFRREELLDYLRARGLAWLEDPSNRDERWSRPRIRHRAIPALEEASSRPVVPRLLDLARTAGRAEAALERTARDALTRAREAARRPGHEGAAATGPPPGGVAGAAEDAAGGPAGARGPRPAEGAGPGRDRIARSEVLRYHPEIRARIVRQLARSRGVRLSRGGTRAAVQFITRGRSGGGVDLAEGLRLGREFDTLWVGPPDPGGADRTLEIPAPGAGREGFVAGGRRYEAEWWVGGPEADDGGPETAEGPEWRVALPLSGVRFPLELRGPRPGDRVRHGAGTRKLKRLFKERRVPVSERPRTPVLADADGRLLWVAGVTGGPTPPQSTPEERLFLGITRPRHADRGSLPGPPGEHDA